MLPNFTGEETDSEGEETCPRDPARWQQSNGDSATRCMLGTTLPQVVVSSSPVPLAPPGVGSNFSS
jgi:hypothetical protein